MIQASESQLIFHFLNGAKIPEYLLGKDGEVAYRWAQGYLLQHKQLPSIEGFCEKFGVNQKPLEPLEEVKQRLLDKLAATGLEESFELAANETDPTRAIGLAMQNLAQVQQKLVQDKQIAKLSDFEDRMVRYIEQRNTGELPRVASFGFPIIDDETNGLEKCDLTVIFARPSDGKSTFARKVATNMVHQGKKVLFFALEEGIDITMMLLESSFAEINSKPYIRMAMEMKEFILFGNKLQGLKAPGMGEVYVVDSLNSISEAQGYILDLQPDVVIVDQLTVFANNLKWDEIAQSIKGFKAAAKAASIPFVVLTQASRGNDVGYSDAIQQYADKMLHILRPKDEDEDQFLRNVNILKNRRGERGRTVPLEWRLSEGIIKELEQNTTATPWDNKPAPKQKRTDQGTQEW